MESPVVDKPAGQVALPIKRVLSFASIIAAGFLLGKFSGILKEMVVSASFGLAGGLDAYVLASLVPTTINNIVAGSAITAAVMPTLGRYLAEGRRDEFWRAASAITNIVLLITGGLTVLGMLLAGPIISILAGGSPAATQALATTMLVIMMPTLFLGALLNMLMAMLNSVDRFAGPALIFIALNVGMIATVVLLTPYLGVQSVAWGFLAGVILQVVVQLIELRREHPQYTWRPDWHHPALKPVLIAFVPITALAITAQINLVVDKSMASALTEGSVAALNYGDVILGAFYMLGYSIGIAVYPNLSRLAAVHDLENTRKTVETSLRLLVFVLAPLTLLIIAFAVPVVGLLFGRGRFDVLAVQMTAQALAMYAVGLVAIAALQLLQRVFYAQADSVTPFIVGAVTAALHVALNLVLMQTMAHGGIALSTSVTAIASVIALVILLERRIGALHLRGLFTFLVKSLTLALLSCVPVVWVYTWAPAAGAWQYLLGSGLAAFGGVIYFGLALVTGTPESQMLVQTAAGWLRRGRS